MDCCDGVGDKAVNEVDSDGGENNLKDLAAVKEDIVSRVARAVDLKGMDDIDLDEGIIDYIPTEEEAVVDAMVSGGPLPELSELVGDVVVGDDHAAAADGENTTLQEETVVGEIEAEKPTAVAKEVFDETVPLVTEWEEKKLLSKLENNVDLLKSDLALRQVKRKLEVRRQLKSRGLTTFDLDRAANRLSGATTRNSSATTSGSSTDTKPPPDVTTLVAPRVLDRF